MTLYVHVYTAVVHNDELKPTVSRHFVDLGTGQREEVYLWVWLHLHPNTHMFHVMDEVLHPHSQVLDCGEQQQESTALLLHYHVQCI